MKIRDDQKKMTAWIAFRTIQRVHCQRSSMTRGLSRDSNKRYDDCKSVYEGDEELLCMKMTMMVKKERSHLIIDQRIGGGSQSRRGRQTLLESQIN